METGIELSKNLSGASVVLCFLLSVITILLSIVAFFLKDFAKDYKETKTKVEKHEVEISMLKTQLT